MKKTILYILVGAIAVVGGLILVNRVFERNSCSFDAFSEDFEYSEDKIVPPEKISPIFKKVIEQRSAHCIVPIQITFPDDPELKKIRDKYSARLRLSNLSQAERTTLFKEQEAELLQRRSSYTAAFVERMKPYGLVVRNEEFVWAIDDLFVELPLGSVKIVADQPEVQKISADFYKPAVPLP